MFIANPDRVFNGLEAAYPAPGCSELGWRRRTQRQTVPSWVEGGVPCAGLFRTGLEAAYPAPGCSELGWRRRTQRQTVPSWVEDGVPCAGLFRAGLEAAYPAPNCPICARIQVNC
jgi:hypothetical protein